MMKELCDKVIEVRRVSDRVMSFVVVFEENILRLIYRHPPQNGRSLEENQSFYDWPKCEWDAHSEDDITMCLSNFKRQR